MTSRNETNLQSEQPRCQDWIFTSGNAHIAKDRAWFSTFTPFTTTLLSLGGSPIPVYGIGTVHIPTKRSPHLRGKSSWSTLILENVLYVPDYICNVIGANIVAELGYSIITQGGKHSQGAIRDAQGKNITFFIPRHPFYAVKVRGLEAGGVVLAPLIFEERTTDLQICLSCYWSREERARWLIPQNKAVHTVPPYTEDEKAFLKRRWRGEYRFLRSQGLNIYKDEDRAEGRRVLRGMREEDDQDGRRVVDLDLDQCSGIAY